MVKRGAALVFCVALVCVVCPGVRGQVGSPPATPSAPGQQPAPAQVPGSPAPETPPASGKGTVLFQSHGDPPAATAEPAGPGRRVLPVSPREPGTEPAENAGGPELTDRQRGSLLFTAYDLDARVAPASGKLTVRARVTARNTGEAALDRIALQVSSALNWESVSLVTPGGVKRLALAQHLLDTDADHTGRASEAVLELQEPLAPGASVTLDAFYSGTVLPSAERLSRIGASGIQAGAADWDRITPTGVWLRGFGNVMWYPVSSPQLFLGEGAKLFEAIEKVKLEEQAATVRLRLSVEYAGDPPAAAYFCGRRAAFKAISDDPDMPTAAGAGVAMAEFAEEPLGFRTPSLFVVARPEVMTASLGGGEPMLALVAADEAVTPALAKSTERLLPLFQQWLGARPLSALTVIAPPVANGQPFEDGPLVVAPLASLGEADALPALTFSLLHAWVQSGRPWVDEGLAQFFALVQVEQERGRDAMVAQLAEMLKPVVLAQASVRDAAQAPAASAESQAAFSSSAAAVTGEPLIATGSELFYRRKAAAVWLMLREIAGEQALQVTLQAWRGREPVRGETAEENALALEAMLEKNSGKDLRGIFEDWVLHDRGLPELTLTQVSPRQLPATASGRSGGWLTAITVNNAGGAMADVPVIVSAGSFSTTVRLTVPGGSSATARVQTEAVPTEVQVNDGITPEVKVSVHRRAVRER